LIDRPPQIVPFAVDTDKGFIEVPLISRLRPPAPELIGILLPKLAAPLADGFVGHHDSAGKEQLFDIAITQAQAEAEVQSDTMADDLGREAVVLVAVDG
jgi:hypothetical protein